MRLNLLILTVCLQAGTLISSPAFALGEASKVVIPQIKYKGGTYNPRPHAVESLLAQMAKRYAEGALDPRVKEVSTVDVREAEAI